MSATTSTPGAPTPPAVQAPTIRRGPAVFAVYRVLLRSLATRGRLLLLGALGLVCIGIGIQVGVSDPAIGQIEAGTRALNEAGLSLLVPVVSLVFASAALGDLVDDRSLVYLWLPPAPRWVLAAAAWAASLTICAPLVVVPLVAAAVATGAESELIVGIAVSSALGVLAYTGLFTALGLRFRRALLWGLAYLLLWEQFVARSGAGAARLSVLSYLRSLLSAYTGVGLSLADRDLALSYVVPVLVGVAGAAYATRRLRVQDID
jgi:ABC-2 type transport system permease protein